MNPKFQELAFDVVLPSHLLVNPNLEPNAKLLYGLVRNLSRLEGYCFARNKYLAEMMEVDPRTIQRWLQGLEEQGYIEKEVHEDGFNGARKIFIVDNFKKSLQCDKNVTHPRKNCQTGTTKMSDIEKEDIEKEDIRKERRENASPEKFKFKKLEMPKEKYDKLIQDYGSEKIKLYLERIDNYADVRPDKFQYWNCHAAVVRMWIEQDNEFKPLDEKDNRKISTDILNEHAKEYLKSGEITITQKGIEFRKGNYCLEILFDDYLFMGKFEEQINKMNINIFTKKC